MERILQIISVLLAAGSGYLYWTGMPDAALVALVFACLVFLLNTRLQSAANNNRRLAEQHTIAEEAAELEENASADDAGLDNPA